MGIRGEDVVWMLFGCVIEHGAYVRVGTWMPGYLMCK